MPRPYLRANQNRHHPRQNLHAAHGLVSRSGRSTTRGITDDPGESGQHMRWIGGNPITAPASSMSAALRPIPIHFCVMIGEIGGTDDRRLRVREAKMTKPVFDFRRQNAPPGRDGPRRGQISGSADGGRKMEAFGERNRCRKAADRVVQLLRQTKSHYRAR